MNGYRGGLPYTYYSQMGRQATPGYNPFSKSPDWASAIREALKNMQMMKQMKEGREQQQWERGITERETAALETRAKAAAQPKEPSQWEQRIRYAAGLVKSEDMTPGDFNKFVLTGDWPEGLTPYQEEMQEHREKGRIQGWLNSWINRIDSRIRKLEMPLTTAQLIQAAQTGTFPKVEVEAKAVKNMNAVKNTLAKLHTESFQRKLTSKEMKTVQDIISNLDLAEKIGPFWESKFDMPFEAKEYLRKHPDISIDRVMKLYEEWKRKTR